MDFSKIFFHKFEIPKSIHFYEKTFQIQVRAGAMVTAAFIGPGTITTCSIAGAKFGYALLWDCSSRL